MASVTAVLCAAFDEATDAQLQAVRHALRDDGLVVADPPAHRPHMSMVATRVERGAELDSVLQVAAEVARHHRPFDVVLSEVGRFDRAGALWLGPRTCPELDALHQHCTTAVADAGWTSAFGERSEPGAWVAHCTLATRVPTAELHRVQQDLAERYRPITARVDAIATILVGGRGDAGYARLG